MTKTRSNYFTIQTTLTFFALFTAIFTFNGAFDQVAFAQENSEDIWIGPTTNALSSFFSQVAESLPKLIAAIILLVIGWIIASIIAKVIQKVATVALKTMNKDEDENATDGLSQVTSSKGSAKLISTVIKWFVFLFFVMAAVNALEFEHLTVAMTNLWLWIPNLLAFVLIVLIGLFLAKFVGKWIEREVIEHDYGNPKYFVLAVQLVIYAVIFAIALTQLGVGQDVISILVSAYAWSIAGGIGAALAIGLGFGLKEMIPGIINSQSKKRSVLKIGQKVQIGDDRGTVTAVELLHVILANENNESIVIPTKDLSNKTIRIFP